MKIRNPFKRQPLSVAIPSVEELDREVRRRFLLKNYVHTGSKYKIEQKSENIFWIYIAEPRAVLGNTMQEDEVVVDWKVVRPLVSYAILPPLPFESLKEAEKYVKVLAAPSITYYDEEGDKV